MAAVCFVAGQNNNIINWRKRKQCKAGGGMNKSSEVKDGVMTATSSGANSEKSQRACQECVS
jgi:hypothetical protein